MLPQIPVIRLADAQKMPLPSYADAVGTCMILRSNTDGIKIDPNCSEIFATGLALALPIGMEAQIRSLKESTQTGVIVLNAPLTIDASDRTEIKVRLFNASQESVIIKKGDPIALTVFSLAFRAKWEDLSQRNNPSFVASNSSPVFEENITSKENVFYEEGIKNTEIQNVSSNQNAKQTKEETA
ncbi:MAG: hypothetical protein E7013_03685 [Alphaproteobacteria bacterium]|nr:hypothetical protein [Alphaproteobacteria bacterium]